MPEGIEVSANPTQGAPAVNDSGTPAQTDKGPNPVTLSPEEYQALIDGNMRQDDYSRNMQVLQTAWTQLQPLVDQYARNPQESQATGKPEMPDDVMRQVLELKQQYGNLENQYKQQQSVNQQIVEANEMKRVQEEESEFADKFPDIVEEFQNIMGQIKTGKIDSYRGNALLENTDYAKVFKIATQFSDKPSPSAMAQGIAKPFGLEDALYLLKGGEFHQGFSQAQQKQRNSWGQTPSVRGKAIVPEPKNMRDAENQVDEIFNKNFSGY